MDDRGVNQLFPSAYLHLDRQRDHLYHALYNSPVHYSPSSSPTTRSPLSQSLFVPSISVPDRPPRDLPSLDQLPDDPPVDEEPLYVNAKQYFRILKRRVARARLEEVHRLSRQRKPYLHESRHNHAMRRARGPGGRFLRRVSEDSGSSPTLDHDDHDIPDHDVLDPEDLQLGEQSIPTFRPPDTFPQASVNLLDINCCPSQPSSPTPLPSVPPSTSLAHTSKSPSVSSQVYSLVNEQSPNGAPSVPFPASYHAPHMHHIPHPHPHPHHHHSDISFREALYAADGSSPVHVPGDSALIDMHRQAEIIQFHVQGSSVPPRT